LFNNNSINDKILMNHVTQILFELIKQNKNQDKIIEFIDDYDNIINPSYVDDNEDTLLLLACYNKLYKVIHKLLSTYKDKCKVEQIGSNSDTILLNLCRDGKYDLVSILIALCGDKCKPEYVGIDGMTALMVTTFNNKSYIPILIETFRDKCNPIATTNENHTVFYYLCSLGYEKLALKMLNKFGNDCKPDLLTKKNNSPFKYTCINNMNELALELLNKYNINSYDKDCLKHAINNNMTEVIIILQHKLCIENNNIYESELIESSNDCIIDINKLKMIINDEKEYKKQNLLKRIEVIYEQISLFKQELKDFKE